MKSKKAISQVIATVLMILLALIAVGTIWITTKNVVDKVQYSPEIQCMEMTKNPTIRILKSCYNQETEDVEVTLKRAINDFEINKLNFVIDSQKFCCGKPDCTDCEILNPTQTKKYLFDFSEQPIPKKISLSIDECFISQKEIGVC